MVLAVDLLRDVKFQETLNLGRIEEKTGKEL
jgi:hypothetical protein